MRHESIIDSWLSMITTLMRAFLHDKPSKRTDHLNFLWLIICFLVLWKAVKKIPLNSFKLVRNSYQVGRKKNSYQCFWPSSATAKFDKKYVHEWNFENYPQQFFSFSKNLTKKYQILLVFEINRKQIFCKLKIFKNDIFQCCFL